MPHEFPRLGGLGFSGAEWVALRQKGFISCERRSPAGTAIYKLRFRVGRQQRTRYVGSAPAAVEPFRQELARLQAPATADRNMRKLVRRARRASREAKRILEPLLAGTGCYYHGFSIRKRRTTGGDDQSITKTIALYGPTS
jgi:hypothetical protein